MAISFITGVPRSGKSYYSVYTIYQMYKYELKKINLFSQWWRYYISPIPPKKMFTNTLTNINEFNFDFHPNIHKLVFQDFIKDLEILYDLQVIQGQPDSVLIDKAKELNLYDTFIVLDEAAHYLTKPINKIIVWWLTYHGHIHQEINIITQHIDQIPSDYLKNGEFFYKMFPPSKAIYKSKFSMGLYSCIKFYKNCKTKDLTIPLNENVGKLYVSGKSAKREQVMTKYILGFIFVILLLFWSINNFLTSISSSSNSSIKNTSINNSDSKVSKDKKEKKKVYKNEDLSKLTLVTFDCISNICSSKKFKDIPNSFILFLLENSKTSFQDSTSINYQLTRFYLLLNDSQISLLSRSFSIEDKVKKSTSPKGLFK